MEESRETRLFHDVQGLAMALFMQQQDFTCWAACIRLLQKLAGVVVWHEPCVSDRNVVRPCTHLEPVSLHNRMLHVDDFTGEGRRCDVIVSQDPASTVPAIKKALRTGVVTILRTKHYLVVLRDCGDHWCVFNPTTGKIVDEAPARMVRNLTRAWTMSSGSLGEDWCSRIL
jgi:hypothetical protein